jgi:DNA-binding YbaB/EbfC family protein
MNEGVNVFGQLGNLASLMKQAQQMGGKLEGISTELKSRRTTGSAGGGMVEVEVNGLQEVLGCKIDPKLMREEDRELLEDLLVGATNEALAKARQLHAEAMQSLAGGMNLPGLQEAMAGLTGGKG